MTTQNNTDSKQDEARTKSYRDHLNEQLKTPEDAGGYLAASLAENADCPDAIRLAIQDIIAAFKLPLEVTSRASVAAPGEDARIERLEAQLQGVMNSLAISQQEVERAARAAAENIVRQYNLEKPGWVTVGRITIDRETETEKFERTTDTATDRITAIITKHIAATTSPTSETAVNRIIETVEAMRKSSLWNANGYDTVLTNTLNTLRAKTPELHYPFSVRHPNCAQCDREYEAPPLTATVSTSETAVGGEAKISSRVISAIADVLSCGVPVQAETVDDGNVLVPADLFDNLALVHRELTERRELVKCVRCGHSNVDREGRCKFQILHPKHLYGNYPVRYCACKCEFTAPVTAAGDDEGERG